VAKTGSLTHGGCDGDIGSHGDGDNSEF